MKLYIVLFFSMLLMYNADAREYHLVYIDGYETKWSECPEGAVCKSSANIYVSQKATFAYIGKIICLEKCKINFLEKDGKHIDYFKNMLSKSLMVEWEDKYQFGYYRLKNNKADMLKDSIKYDINSSVDAQILTLNRMPYRTINSNLGNKLYKEKCKQVTYKEFKDNVEYTDILALEFKD